MTRRGVARRRSASLVGGVRRAGCCSAGGCRQLVAAAVWLAGGRGAARRASWRRWSLLAWLAAAPAAAGVGAGPGGGRRSSCSARVTLVAVPVLGRFGARADNPTLLDRDYVAGWLVLAGAGRRRRGRWPVSCGPRSAADGRRRRWPGCSSSTTTRPCARWSSPTCAPPATRSIEAGRRRDGAARRCATTPRRPGRARPDAARASTGSRSAGGCASTRDVPVIMLTALGRRGRPGGRARARRRRLRHQAVQPARARAAGRLGAAPRRGRAPAEPRRLVDGDLVVDRDGARGVRGRRAAAR